MTLSMKLQGKTIFPSERFDFKIQADNCQELARDTIPLAKSNAKYFLEFIGIKISKFLEGKLIITPSNYQ